MAIDLVKLERFGENFLKVIEKMHFHLATFKVVYTLDTPRLEKDKNETMAEIHAT